MKLRWIFKMKEILLRLVNVDENCIAKIGISDCGVEVEYDGGSVVENESGEINVIYKKEGVRDGAHRARLRELKYIMKEHVLSRRRVDYDK
jgi:hypothetical protein